MPVTTPWRYGSGVASHAAPQALADRCQPLARHSVAQQLIICSIQNLY
jgi:hypothetical protein